MVGLERRLQNERVAEIAARDANVARLGRDWPSSVPSFAKQRRETRRAVEARQAQPVYRTVASNEREGLAIADDGVIFDTAGHQGLDECGRTRQLKLLVRVPQLASQLTGSRDWRVIGPQGRKGHEERFAQDPSRQLRAFDDHSAGGNSALRRWRSQNKDPGGGKCGCACTINSNDYPGGGIVTLVNYNNPAGYACSAFNGATCSASDPATGGVRTGTVGMCGAAWTTVSITYSPFTGLSVLHGSAGLLPR